MKETLPEIMPLEERKVTLTKLARRKEFGRGFHGRGVIEAIEALNKIDGIYKQTVIVEHEVIHTFVFQLPDGTKFIPGLSFDSTRDKLPERTATSEPFDKTQDKPTITTDISIVK